jgi:hypothetical protein
VKPARLGAVVELQRLSHGVWKKIARLPVRADGSFSRNGKTAAGKYRVRSAGSPGLVAGYSPQITVR